METRKVTEEQFLAAIDQLKNDKNVGKYIRQFIHENKKDPEFLKAKLNMSYGPKTGDTALTAAVRICDDRLVEYIINSLDEVNHLNDKKESAFSIASENLDILTFEILVKNSSKMFPKDQLQQAASKSLRDLARRHSPNSSSHSKETKRKIAKNLQELSRYSTSESKSECEPKSEQELKSGRESKSEYELKNEAYRTAITRYFKFNETEYETILNEYCLNPNSEINDLLWKIWRSLIYERKDLQKNPQHLSQPMLDEGLKRLDRKLMFVKQLRYAKEILSDDVPHPSERLSRSPSPARDDHARGSHSAKGYYEPLFQRQHSRNNSPANSLSPNSLSPTNGLEHSRNPSPISLSPLPSAGSHLKSGSRDSLSKIKVDDLPLYSNSPTRLGSSSGTFASNPSNSTFFSSSSSSSSSSSAVLLSSPEDKTPGYYEESFNSPHSPNSNFNSLSPPSSPSSSFSGSSSSSGSSNPDDKTSFSSSSSSSSSDTASSNPDDNVPSSSSSSSNSRPTTPVPTISRSRHQTLADVATYERETIERARLALKSQKTPSAS